MPPGKPLPSAVQGRVPAWGQGQLLVSACQATHLPEPGTATKGLRATRASEDCSLGVATETDLPAWDPGFRGLFPGGGKRDRLAGVGGQGAWIGSESSGRLGAGGHSSRLAPRPQHRHTQALRGFGHRAPAAQGLGRKTGQLRQHPSTAAGRSGWSTGAPGALCGQHICDCNPQHTTFKYLWEAPGGSTHHRRGT